ADGRRRAPPRQRIHRVKHTLRELAGLRGWAGRRTLLILRLPRKQTLGILAREGERLRRVPALTQPRFKVREKMCDAAAIRVRRTEKRDTARLNHQRRAGCS